MDRILLNKKYKIIILATALVAIVLIAQMSGVREVFNIESIRGYFDHHWFVSSLIFMALFTIGNFLQIPGWVFLVAAVLSLGQLKGGALTFVGAMTSCTVSFFVIEKFGKGALHSLKYKWIQSILAKLDSYPIRSIFLLRLVFQTAPALNYTLALSKVSFKNYFIGTVLSLPFPITVYCIFFDNIFKRFL